MPWWFLWLLDISFIYIISIAYGNVFAAGFVVLGFQYKVLVLPLVCNTRNASLVTAA